jgi:hypothetical protein
MKNLTNFRILQKEVNQLSEYFNLSRETLFPENSKLSILYSFRIQQEYNLFLKTLLKGQNHLGY